MLKESKNIRKLKKLINYNEFDQTLNELDRAYDTINEINGDGYWVWDIEKESCYLSSTLKKMLGYNNTELTTYKALNELLVGNDEQRFLIAFNDYVKNRENKPIQIILNYYHKNGSTLRLLCRGLITNWGINNEPMKMIGSYVNVTNCKSI